MFLLILSQNIGSHLVFDFQLSAYTPWIFPFYRAARYWETNLIESVLHTAVISAIGHSPRTLSLSLSLCLPLSLSPPHLSPLLSLTHSPKSVYI